MPLHQVFHWRYAGSSYKQDTTWFERIVQVLYRTVEIKRILQHLRQDDTIKCGLRQRVLVLKIGNDGRVRVWVDREDVATLDSISAEAARVFIVLQFQHLPANMRSIISEKSLNVDAINRLAPTRAPAAIDRR